jgi:uncharacterized membrane protein YfcA
MSMVLKLLLLGLFVGFVSGLFGKGGSAIATPLLQLIGVSAFYAVASPLPAAIPGTLVASLAYVRQGLYDRKVVLWSIGVGLPTTVIGAWLSQYTGGAVLLLLSNLIIVGLGLSFLLPLMRTASGLEHHTEEEAREVSVVTNVLVAASVGLVSGLLANSGGFLLAPLYNKVLKLPLKTAFACSLVVSAALAVPGTLVHIYLHHIDWKIVLYFALGSIPFSYLGANTAIKMPVKALEPLFGLMLTIIGLWGMADSLGFHFLRL